MFWNLVSVQGFNISVYTNTNERKNGRGQTNKINVVYSTYTLMNDTQSFSLTTSVYKLRTKGEKKKHSQMNTIFHEKPKETKLITPKGKKQK